MKSSTKFKIALMIFVIGLYFISMASALTVQSFSVNPNEIAPGKTGEISVLLKNNGEEDLEDVVVSLDLNNSPFAPYNSGSSYSTDLIESDESKRIGFEIVALNTATSGIYKIPVHITYKEDSVIKNVDSLISVMVNSDPILEVIIEDGLLLKGKNNKVTLKVINKGLADVKFLDIELGNSNYYTTTSARKVYIGDVDSNDFQTADFNMNFNTNAPGNVNIPVSLTYKDITSKEYTMNSVLNAKVYSQKEAVNLGLVKKSNSIYYVAIVITLILVFILYRVIRNRRRKSSEY